MQSVVSLREIPRMAKTKGDSSWKATPDLAISFSVLAWELQ